MGAVLKQTVRAGGVTYPAGTPATTKLRKLIKAKFWTDGPAPRSSAVDNAEIEQLRALAADEIAKRDARIAELEAAAGDSAYAEQLAEQVAAVEEAQAKLDEATAEIERLTGANAELASQVEDLTKAPDEQAGDATAAEGEQPENGSQES